MATTETARRPHGIGDRVMGVVWGDDAHLRDAAIARRRRLALAGVVAISSVSGLIALLHAFAIPAFQPPDETAHIAYAFAVTEGHIPRIDEFPGVEHMPHMRTGLSVWVTNHPPLLYALLGVPLRLGELVGSPLAGFYLARVVLVGAAAVGYLLVGWLATLLLPGREGAAVIATGVAALVPNSLHIAGMAYGDGAGFTLVTALLVAAVVVLQRGVSARRAVVLTLLAVVAANTRATGLAAAAGCIACLGLAELVHGRGTTVVRLARGALWSVASGVVTLLSAGWFYVGFNLARYGSLTGSQALMDLHSREPSSNTVALRVVHPSYVGSLSDQYWARLEAHAEGIYVPDLLVIAGRWAIGIGLLVAALVGLWRLSRGSWRQPAALALSWAVAVGWFVALYVGMADFVQAGGGSHLRYLWPAVGTFGVVMAGAATAPRGRWGVVPAVGFVGLQTLVAAIVITRLVFRPDVPGPVIALRALAADAPLVAAAVLAGAGVVGLAGLAWWVYAVASLLVDDDRSHLAAPARGWAIGVGGTRRIEVRPADVALATLAGTAAGWLVAFWVGIHVDLPTLAAVVAVAAAAASVLARRRPPDRVGPAAQPPGGSDAGASPATSASEP